MFRHLLITDTDEQRYQGYSSSLPFICTFPLSNIYYNVISMQALHDSAYCSSVTVNTLRAPKLIWLTKDSTKKKQHSQYLIIKFYPHKWLFFCSNETKHSNNSYRLRRAERIIALTAPFRVMRHVKLLLVNQSAFLLKEEDQTGSHVKSV